MDINIMGFMYFCIFFRHHVYEEALIQKKKKAMALESSIHF